MDVLNGCTTWFLPSSCEMPYIRFYAVSEPSLYNSDDLTESDRYGSVLQLLRFWMLRGLSRRSVADPPAELPHSDSWVYVPHKSRTRITDTSFSPVARAGPNSPRRNRRSVKTFSHSIWTQPNLSDVISCLTTSLFHTL